MHKTIVASPQPTPTGASEGWLDLSRVARVELTSEDPAHPIEAALEHPTPVTGWRAGTPGPQTITLQFNPAQNLRLIYLRFDCFEAKTHEFQLACRCAGETKDREIVRQQFHFSPGGATAEEESYQVDLRQVTHLTLSLTPDISGRPAHATLREMRVR